MCVYLRLGTTNRSLQIAGLLCSFWLAACGDSSSKNDGAPGDGPADGGSDGSTDAGDGGSEPTWEVVLSQLDGGLVSVWGTGADNVWTVGGDPGEGQGPMVLHFDGTEWTSLDTGTTGTLWWVFGFEGGDIWMGGEGGIILRYASEIFEVIDTPAPATVFGIWGAAADDVWAVGGEAAGSSAFIWRLDGEEFVVPSGLPAEISNTAAVWKVWGCAADNVEFVGTNGLMVNFDGANFVVEPWDVKVLGSQPRPLLTVHVEAGTCHAGAVGGVGGGVILEKESGGAWANATPTNTLALNGIWLAGDTGFAVGVVGAILRRTAEEWLFEPTVDTSLFLHGVWMDPDGGAWAVGAIGSSFPVRDGTLLYRGNEKLPTSMGGF